jgi:hypothetical protein
MPAAAGIAASAAGAIAALAAAAAAAAGGLDGSAGESDGSAEEPDGSAGEPDAAAGLAVVLAGGLMANADFAAAVCGAVRTVLPAAQVGVLAAEPVAGAIRLAAAAALAEADPPGT